MSLTGLYVGSVLVVLDMSLTILALVLNLAVVIGLRYQLKMIRSMLDTSVLLRFLAHFCTLKIEHLGAKNCRGTILCNLI